MSNEPCGPPSAHFADWYEDELEPPAEPEADGEIEIPVELEGVVDDGRTIPIVFGASPGSRESPAAPVDAPVQVVISIAARLEGPGSTEEAANAPLAPIETLEELSIALESQHDLAEVVVALADHDEFPEDDPYEVFVRTLAEVAVATGATMDAGTIDALLGSDEVATAWRAILRGESEDFSHCEGTLDEWAANALASLLSAPHKAPQLRRELRARGVAAFGLIDAS